MSATIRNVVSAAMAVWMFAAALPGGAQTTLPAVHVMTVPIDAGAEVIGRVM